jgi:hypothetical protein
MKISREQYIVWKFYDHDRTEILLQVALKTINQTKLDNLFAILLFEFKNMYSSKHLILHCSH